MKLNKTKLKKWRPVVNGREWQIRFVKGLNVEGAPCWGTCDETERTIEIDADVKGTMLLSTLVHELCHAFSFEHGFKLRHKTLNPLEKAITTFLLENGFHE